MRDVDLGILLIHSVGLQSLVVQVSLAGVLAVEVVEAPLELVIELTQSASEVIKRAGDIAVKLGEFHPELADRAAGLEFGEAAMRILQVIHRQGEGHCEHNEE